MFKVSFKEDYKKVQIFNNKATLITLVGELKIPITVWKVFPDDVSNWMWEHQGVDVQWGICTKDNEVFRIEVTGKSVCAEEDSFDAVTGQRIAESRAKIKLFKFMHTLLGQLYEYYFGLVLGDRFSSKCISQESETGNECIFDEMGKYMGLMVKESHHLGKLLKEA